MKIASIVAALAGLAASVPSTIHAQDEPAAGVYNDFVEISVDINLTHLEATVGAVIVECELRSFFDTGTDGESNADAVGRTTFVIHGGMFEVFGEPPSYVPLTEFERMDFVFGNGGSRQINRTLELFVGPLHNPTRLEEWNTGTCAVQLLHESDNFDPAAEGEVVGALPETCLADVPTRLYNCVRPGTDPSAAIFSFRREF